MVIIESERLLLRELEASDTEALAHIWGDNEVMKYCGGGELDTNIIHEVIEANQKKYRAYGYAVFAIVVKPDGVLVGAAGCKPEEADPRRGELIYHFNKAVWGKGYASEAVAAYLKWAAETGCIDYISASAMSENAASLRILEKNGFKQNGFVQFEDTGFVPEPFYERYLMPVPYSG